MIDANPPRRWSAGSIGLIGLAAIAAALVAARLGAVITTFGAYTDCRECFVLPVLAHDAWLLAAMLGALALSAWTRRVWLQRLAVIAAVLLMLVCAVDLAVLKTLSQRLYLRDVIKFGKEVGAIWEFNRVFLESRGGKIALAGAVVLIVIVVLALWRRPAQRTLGASLSLAALVCLGGAIAGRYVSLPYVWSEAYLNVFEVNLEQGVDTRYSTVFEKNVEANYHPADPVCSDGENRKPNIIVLVVESLSAYQSKLFSGVKNLTPNVDRLASENTWFSNFYANGFTTDHGLIAIVNGRPPIPAVGRYASVDAFAGFKHPRDAMPEAMRGLGYTTHFFTTGSLGFTDKAAWLKGTRFDTYEGAEQPFYNGWKRRHFNAAEDRALYLRFEQWLGERKDPRPFAAIILTVSTHPPFIDPRTEAPGEDGVFNYADLAIGGFVAALEQRGYFRNGVLLITGDHRAMTPLHEEELKLFGETALARVPLIVIGASTLPKGMITEPFQQSDIGPSIEQLAGAHVCRRPDQGLIFATPEEPPSHVVHVRGDQRSRIDVYEGKQRAALLLDGDNSHWTGDALPDAAAIALEVHADRIARGEAHDDFLDFIIDSVRPKTPGEK